MRIKFPWLLILRNVLQIFDAQFSSSAQLRCFKQFSYNQTTLLRGSEIKRQEYLNLTIERHDNHKLHLTEPYEVYETLGKSSYLTKMENN